jgi:two-component system, NarL family, sensor histidine kinase UhpB
MSNIHTFSVWRRLLPWRDLLLALALAIVAAVLASMVEFHERLFSATRRWEFLQLDELPVAVFVFALCLVVLFARRHAELRHALHENRELSRRLLEVQEDERKALARELHDELGQYLNAIKLDALALVAEGIEAAPLQAAQRVVRNTDHVYGVVRHRIGELRPTALDELGLAAALEACVARWRASEPRLQISLRVSGAVDDCGERVGLSIYRIVQEALTNCVRHAAATTLSIELSSANAVDRQLLLVMHDDGAGFDPAQQMPSGRGIAGMRERVDMLGGQFELQSRPGAGVTIRVTLPAQSAST